MGTGCLSRVLDYLSESSCKPPVVMQSWAEVVKKSQSPCWFKGKADLLVWESMNKQPNILEKGFTFFFSFFLVVVMFLALYFPVNVQQIFPSLGTESPCGVMCLDSERLRVGPGKSLHYYQCSINIKLLIVDKSCKKK